jgi:tetratricopeptide (TPR) repeat protein
MGEHGKESVRDLVVRGHEHYVAREYEKAERCFTEALRENIAYADVHNMLGVIYHQQGRLAEAEGMFQRAVATNPAYTEAALNLAVTYNDLGKYPEAQEVYERVLVASKGAGKHLDPFAKGKLANMHADLGAAYDAVALYADAVREYQRALTLCPTFADIRTRLGITLHEMGEAAEALRELERVRQENPRFVSARLHLGLCYRAAGRLADAAAEWRAVLETSPDNKSALLYLSVLEPPRVQGDDPGVGA